MPLAITVPHDIGRVINVTADGDGLRVSFAGGTAAHLETSHPNFATYQVNVEFARSSSRPVGIVLTDDNGISDLNICHDTSVRAVTPFSNDPERFQVSFWGYSPICGLASDQSGFERMYAVLVEAARTGQMVWVAIHSEDTLDDEPDEDGRIAALPKVMDVRLK